MDELKFELVIVYYKRPEIVKNALDSIKNLLYDNWHLTFIDDSGDDSFKDTFLNYGFDENKIEYVPIMMSDQKKVSLGGSIFGMYINHTIKKSDSDIFILICDDDALVPDYLNNLNTFYNQNPNSHWGYCHVKLFNPNVEYYKEAENRSTVYDWSLNMVNLNGYTTPITPSCKVDSSQVSFRIKSLISNNIWYAYPRTRDLDRDIFEKMTKIYGKCDFTNCFGQYKGWFEDQLGVRFRTNRGDYY